MEKYLQDWEVGDTYTSLPRIVTVWDMETWCALSGDMHPVLLRDDYAQGLGFKSRVASVGLIQDMAVGMLVGVGLFHDLVSHVGFDRVRFMAPVYPYDKIRTSMEVLNKRVTSKGDRVVVTYKWEVRKEQDVLCAEGENTVLLKRYHEP